MSYASARQSVLSAFQTAHEANYPTVPVDYPNRPIVDVEHRDDPFVKVELIFPKSRQMCLGNSSVRVGGELYVVFYAKVGSGIKTSIEYVDFIVDTFSLETIGALTFNEIIPLPEVSYPSWIATRIRIPFTTEFYV